MEVSLKVMLLGSSPPIHACMGDGCDDGDDDDDDDDDDRTSRLHLA